MRLVNFRIALASIATSCFALAAQSSCYTVYDGDGRIALRSVRPPVDLSKTLSETVPRLVPNGHMVFVPDESSCSDVEYRAATLTPMALAQNDAETRGTKVTVYRRSHVAVAPVPVRDAQYNPAELLRNTKEVDVRPPYRKNGTYVAGHTRSARGRK